MGRGDRFQGARLAIPSSLDAAPLGERAAFGSQPDLAEVSRSGFTHVVNLRGEHDERARAAELGLDHLWIRWTDQSALQRDLTGDLNALVDYVERALEDPSARVFIHCAAGLERAPMAAYVLLRTWGLDDAEARAYLRRVRPGMLSGLLDGNSYAIASFLHERASSPAQ